MYITWFEKKNRIFYPKQLEEEFGGLYPGRNARKQIYEYYRKKTESAIKLGVAGLLIVMICVYKQMVSSDIKDGKYLERNPQGGGNKEITLDAEIGEAKMEDVTITVGEQELSEEEKELINILKL